MLRKRSTTSVFIPMAVLLTIGAMLTVAPSAYAEKTCVGVCKNKGDTTIDNSQDNDVTTTTTTDNDICTTTGGTGTGGAGGAGDKDKGGGTGGAGTGGAGGACNF